MADTNTFMRLASRNEQRVIAREAVGFYNAVFTAGLYQFADDTDVKSIRTFAGPLKRCLEKYPFLTVVIKNGHTEKAYFERVVNLDLGKHVVILDGAADANILMALEKVLPTINDQVFSSDLPPWQVVVLPLFEKLGRLRTNCCFIIFAYSHGLGDGQVGPIFHRALLNALGQEPANTDESLMFTTSPTRSLPKAFDTPKTLPISWGYLLSPLLAVYLPKFIGEYFGLRATVSTINDDTWTGLPIFFDRANSTHTRVKLVEISAMQLHSALAECRRHCTTLTGILQQFIVRALSRVIPNTAASNFVCQTAINMRRAVSAPTDSWGSYVTGQYEMFSRVNPSDPISWEAARHSSEELAKTSMRLQDQPIGLLRYMPSIRRWTLGKLGKVRDSSFEISNLGAFDFSEGGPRCRISKMVFGQPGNVPSAPIVFSVVSIRGGDLVIAVSWQAGALGVGEGKEMCLVDGLCESLRADFEALGNNMLE